MAQRIQDAAVLASVVSEVLKKNAALRRQINSVWWTSSSIGRQVGQERRSRDSFWTADTSAEVDPVDQAAAGVDAVGRRAALDHAAAKSAVAFEQRFREARPSQIEDKATMKAPEDDLFMLRNARGGFMKTPPPWLKDRRHTGTQTEPNLGAGRSSGIDHATPSAEAASLANTAATSSARSIPAADVAESTAASRLQTDEPPVDTVSGSAAAPDTESEEMAAIGSSLRSSAVPSSRLSRLYHYTALGSSLAFNSFSDGAKRLFVGGESKGLMSDRNVDLLVSKLSRMRGAALKLGQMISFQEDSLPEPIKIVMQRVQDSADYMPDWQLNKVMATEFGLDWRETRFKEFNDVPIAAASIGQVHRATLPDGREVAVKVQYPGVANSISSDLKNLGILLNATRLLPKGLFLDKTIANARTELAWECDYVREAAHTKRFRELVGDDPAFKVPEVIDECTGNQVLTTEFLHGKGIAKSQKYSRELRDRLGSDIMRLCLQELAEFNFMQTDPNWTNFLYNEKSGKIELLDFGAARSFDKTFIDRYCRLLVAAAQGDRTQLETLSRELGYLTGDESQGMVDAHIKSILTLAEPFSFATQDRDTAYNFAGQTITERVKEHIPLMLRERLAPPPEETYSLHRRLSGHFMLCARLKSRIPCRKIFEDVMRKNGYL